MTRRLFAVLAIMSIFAMFATAARGATWGDDPNSNTASYLNGSKWDPAVPGCDTLDGTLTVNALAVHYKCNVDPLVPSNQGILDLTAFEMIVGKETINSPQEITIRWTTRGKIPDLGSLNVVSGVGGYSFQVWFKNPNRQNARQTVGDTLDCTRYAHMGPYLTGNNEYIVIYSGLVLGESGWTVDQGWGHYDPMTNSLWAFVPDPQGIPSSYCQGTTRVDRPGGFAGTGMVSTIINNGHTLQTKIPYPYTFRWVDNEGNELSYQLVSPGDVLFAITPTSGGNVDAATVDEISVDVDGDGTPDVYRSKQGVSLTFLLDWLPWGAFDLGLVPNPSGISEIPSALCPGYHALEYQPGGGKNNTGGTYLPLTKGPNGQDRDTQANTFYGLNHYDSSGSVGFTSNDLINQDHNGTNTCTSPVPGVSRFTSTGGSLTAG